MHDLGSPACGLNLGAASPKPVPPSADLLRRDLEDLVAGR
jgi:hypothetical protein